MFRETRGKDTKVTNIELLPMGEDIPANSNGKIMEAYESMEWNGERSSAMLHLREKTKKKNDGEK